MEETNEQERWLSRLKFYLEGEPPEKIKSVIRYIKYVYWEKVSKDFDDIENCVDKGLIIDSKTLNKEEYSQSQLSEYKEKLKAEIKIALIGIDKTDKHDYNGWWETSSGAEFGENKLIEVLTLIDKI